MGAKPELDPDVDDLAPTGPEITTYDQVHFITYLRLLDAEDDAAEWTEVARIVLHRDPATEGERTRACWESHLARAQWMTKAGYRKILEQAAAEARSTRHGPSFFFAMVSGSPIAGHFLLITAGAAIL